jgi:hypothetical protein
MRINFSTTRVTGGSQENIIYSEALLMHDACQSLECQTIHTLEVLNFFASVPYGSLVAHETKFMPGKNRLKDNVLMVNPLKLTLGYTIFKNSICTSNTALDHYKDH